MIDIREADAVAVLTGTPAGCGGIFERKICRRPLIAAAEPKARYRALFELERRTPCVTLITQKVDGLHDLAGSQRFRKIHGDI